MKSKEDVNILFKQGNTDDRILKSMAEDTEHEYDSEELSKALDKAKLVQKEVQVRGKNGQMHTRKQWVKAGEDHPVPAAGGSGGGDGGNKVTGKGKTINQNHWTKVGTSQEAKSQIAQMLASGKSREDCMEDFKAQGVTWKEHENQAINWMRAAMAMNKHLTSSSSGLSKDSIPKTDKTKESKENTKSSKDKVDINLSDYTLKGDFYSVTETAKMFDLGVQVALCKKLGIDPDKYTVIQPEDADDPKSFDKFSSEINKQIGDYETMEFDDDDPDADGVNIQEYKQFSINGKTCVALSDAGMNSFIIPTEMYNKTEETKANNSVIGSDYTQLTTEKESGTIEGEAHNMMVGWLKSENGGNKKPTESQIKQAANSLKDAAIKRVISSYNQDELVHQLAMAKHFTKLAGGNMDHMTLERTYQDVVSGSSYTQEQKCDALAKLCGKDYDSTGDYVRKYASNSMANASIVPMSKGYFEVTFSYDDGVSRKERFDSVKSAKEAADKFIEKEEKYTSTNSTSHEKPNSTLPPDKSKDFKSLNYTSKQFQDLVKNCSKDNASSNVKECQDKTVMSSENTNKIWSYLSTWTGAFFDNKTPGASPTENIITHGLSGKTTKEQIKIMNERLNELCEATGITDNGGKLVINKLASFATPDKPFPVINAILPDGTRKTSSDALREFIASRGTTFSTKEVNNRRKAIKDSSNSTTKSTN